MQRHAFLGFHDVVFRGAFHQLAREIALVANVFFRLATLHAIERRLRDVDVIALDEFLHVPEEKCQQQRADVAAIHVRVGHQDDFVIAQLASVEIVFANAGAERGDNGANFFMPQHLVVARFFNVEDFSLERQDGLIFAIAPLLGRAAGRLAFNDEQFAPRRIAFLAIREFAGQPARIHRGLAAREFAGLAGGFAGAGRIDALGNDAARHSRMFVKPFTELFVYKLFDVAFDVAVQLAFGLPLKLRLRQPHADHGHETFTNVVTGDGDFVLLLLEHARLRSEIVDGPRQSGTKTGKVCAAIHGVDGVRKRKNIFAVGIVVLQRDFDFDVPALSFHVDGRVVQRRFSAVQVLHEFRDAACKAEFGILFRALVCQRNPQSLVQESQLAQALRERIEAVFSLIENRQIRMKRDFRPGLARLSGLLQLGSGLTFFVGLFPHFTVARNFQLQPIGKRIDDGNTNAVQTARHFVGFAVEFSASVQYGHHHLGGGTFLGRVHVHGNAAAVVHHGDGVVRVHRDVDFIREAGQRFVDRIVHHFPDEMVQAHLTRRPDIHGGTQTHCFQAAEDFDRFRVVLVAALRRGAHVFFVAHVISWRCNG